MGQMRPHTLLSGWQTVEEGQRAGVEPSVGFEGAHRAADCIQARALVEEGLWGALRAQHAEAGVVQGSKGKMRSDRWP